MSKTRTDLWTPTNTPSIYVEHIAAEDTDTGLFDFHIIAASDAYCCWIWAQVYNCVVPANGWSDYPALTPEQEQMIRWFYSDQGMLSTCCYYCNGRKGHPILPRWNRLGSPYPYHVPCCVWNGDFMPYTFTPDHWPPHFLHF